MKIKIKAIIICLLPIFIIGICLVFTSFYFEIKGKEIIKLTYNDKYVDEGAKVRFLYKDLSKGIKTKNNVNTSKIGKYEVKYTYTIGPLEISRKRQVEVIDDIPPVIQLTGEEQQTVCPNKEYIEEGYKAFDEYDKDLTDKVQVIKEDGSIKYKVSDSSNNTTIAERKIIKKDEDKPNIKLANGNLIYTKIGKKYNDPGYTVTDNCDENLKDKVEVIGKVDTNTLGEYELVYKVKDSSGNETEAKRKVIVNNVKTTKYTGPPGVIYLTFDDGPTSGGSTKKILDVLKQEEVKATFFVTGTGPDNLIKRAHDEGHVIALHTYSHDYKDIYTSMDDYFEDLTKIEQRVKRITGTSSKITRFPGGSNNTVSKKYNSNVMENLRIEVEKRGYMYFDWNVDSNDAGACARSNVTDKKGCVYKYVTSNLSKSRVNVVLMHDIKSYTADALSDIIKYGKNNGYTFEVLTKDGSVNVKF